MAITHNQFYPQQTVGYQQPIQQPVYQAPVPPQIPQQSPTISNIYYVQGEAAAKAYPVAFGKGIVLFDSERDYFYLKEVDRFGVPKPLRKFPYREELEDETQATVQLQADVENDFVTRSEFEKRIAELSTPAKKTKRKEEEDDG